MSTRRQFLTKTAASFIAGASLDAVHSAIGSSVAAKPKKGSEPHAVLRLAIIGTGQISHRYLKQAGAGKRARFVATCARHLESAKARALEYGVDAWFDNYETMYEQVTPDAVVVATPNSLHAAPTIAALERGIHVLCEKPMATTWSDCRAMAEAARRSSALLLCLPYDAVPAYITALGYLNEYTLGVFTGAEAQLLESGSEPDSWSYDRKIDGGEMLDSMIYPVSRLIGFLGPAARVTGFVNTLIPHRIISGSKIVESTIDDNVSLILEWETGQHAILRTLCGTSMDRNDSAIYGRHGTLWLSGNDLVIQSTLRTIPGSTPTTWDGIPGCYRISTQELRDISEEGLIDHFVDCILGSKTPTCGWQQQLHVNEILFKGYEAASSGRAQRLETTFVPWHHVDPAFYDTHTRPV